MVGKMVGKNLNISEPAFSMTYNLGNLFRGSGLGKVLHNPAALDMQSTSCDEPGHFGDG
jgi:hypothetical protein